MHHGHAEMTHDQNSALVLRVAALVLGSRVAPLILVLRVAALVLVLRVAALVLGSRVAPLVLALAWVLALRFWRLLHHGIYQIYN